MSILNSHYIYDGNKEIVYNYIFGVNFNDNSKLHNVIKVKRVYDYEYMFPIFKKFNLLIKEINIDKDLNLILFNNDYLRNINGTRVNNFTVMFNPNNINLDKFTDLFNKYIFDIIINKKLYIITFIKSDKFTSTDFNNIEEEIKEIENITKSII